MLSYRTYGLLISSEIELPELALGEGEPDVRITRGTVAERDAPLRYGLGVELLLEGIYLSHPVAGRALVTLDGIRLDPAPNCTPLALREFVLGHCVGGLLHLRGYLVLHASACLLGEAAVAIMGVSGSGKSTAAAVLARAGHPVLADDVVAVDMNAEPRVLPGPALVRLRSDGSAPKSVHNHAGTAAEVRLGHLLVLERGESAAVSPVRAGAACLELVRNCYCGNLRDPRAPGRLLEMCARLSLTVPMSKLTRADEPLDERALAGRLEAIALAGSRA